MKAIILYLLFVFSILTGCNGCMPQSSPTALQPIINGAYKNAQAVFYPSTDYKVASIIVDEKGDVHYIRMNCFGTIKDQKKLFNVNEFCH